MRFGEAIRLGIGAVREDKTLFLGFDSEGPKGCAIGTALYSLGMTSYEKRWEMLKQDGIYDFTHKQWPWLAAEISLIPRSVISGEISLCISVLHNTGGKTRAELADLADMLDPSIPPIDLLAVPTTREEVLVK